MVHRAKHGKWIQNDWRVVPPMLSGLLKFSWEIAHYGKSLISDFQDIFAGINKIFILGVGLSTILSFYRVLRLSRYFLISQDPKCLVVPHFVRELVYTMVRSNNRASFHLW